MTLAVLSVPEKVRSEEEGQDASLTAAMIVSTMVEELTLSWCDDTAVMTRDELLRVIAGSLLAVLEILG